VTIALPRPEQRFAACSSHTGVRMGCLLMGVGGRAG
jgi:hypothetical protein